MVHFFFGSDTYTLSQELKKLKVKFSLIEELEITPDYSDGAWRARLQELLESQGLFAGKKLVILKNFVGEIHKYPKSEEYLLKLVNQQATSSSPIYGLTIIFVQTESFDARRSFFKALKKIAQAKEFTVPTGKALETWIKDYLKVRGFQIEKEALDHFLELMGEEYNLWQAANDLEKLMLYAKFPNIDISSVKQIATPNISQNVFALTNSFAEGNAREAVKILESLLGRGPAFEVKRQALQTVAALASQIRSLLLLKELENQPPEQAAKILGWKEGRVWINRKLSKKFNAEKLKSMLKDLAAIDKRLKTSEEPPKLLLTLFLQKARV